MTPAQKAPGKSSSRCHGAVGGCTNETQEPSARRMRSSIARDVTTDNVVRRIVNGKLGVPHTPNRVTPVCVTACSVEDLRSAEREKVSGIHNRSARSTKTHGLIPSVSDVCRSPDRSSGLSRVKEHNIRDCIYQAECRPDLTSNE